MEKSNISFDLGMLTIYKMLAYQRNPDKIERDELYKLTQEYLKYSGANSSFLDKPAIIERVTNIIFNNLLLKKSYNISVNGIEYKDNDNNNFQKFAVLKDGSIIFYNQIETSKKVFSVDVLDEKIACRFMEYYKDNGLKSEKRVIIDEYGYDNKFFEISNISSKYFINEKFREQFKNIIDHVDGMNLYVYLDLGNPSIVPELDTEYLYDSKNRRWESNSLYDDSIDIIKFGEDEEVFLAYPNKLRELQSYDVQIIKDNYTYFVTRYPKCKRWFIDRYGKSFLIENGIIEKDDDMKEKNLFEKIESANIEEVLVNYNDFKLNDYQILEFIKKLYNSSSYEKSIALFKKLNEDQKIEFIKNNQDYKTEFIATCISSLEYDNNKIDLLYDEDFEFDTWNKVSIIASLKDEELKVELYNEYEDEIEDVDTEKLDSMSEDESIAIYSLLSEVVLDSLHQKNDIRDFIIRFRSFPIIKYSNIKDFTKEEISELLEELEDDIDIDEYIAFFRTGKLEDDYIINMLNNNWEEGLELSQDNEIEMQNDLNCTFKVLALLNVKDVDKRLSFLDENIDFFDYEEISMILENVEDVKRILELSKKYNLPEDYYYYFMTLAEDEEKIQLLDNEEKIDLENFIRIVSSFEDTNNAFEYILCNDKINVIDKMSAVNELKIDYDNDDNNIYDKKFEFLKKNSAIILQQIKTPEAKEVFRIFTNEYDCDNVKLSFLESKFTEFFEDEERL